MTSTAATIFAYGQYKFNISNLSVNTLGKHKYWVVLNFTEGETHFIATTSDKSIIYYVNEVAQAIQVTEQNRQLAFKFIGGEGEVYFIHYGNVRTPLYIVVTERVDGENYKDSYNSLTQLVRRRGCAWK
jgi:hypothetical protein